MARLDRIRLRRDGISAASWRLPGHDAGLVLGQVPAGRLFGLVVPPAKRREVAFARCATLVERHGVVNIAADGRAPAARKAAGALADADKVAQRPRRAVAAGSPGVAAGPGF